MVRDPNYFLAGPRGVSPPPLRDGRLAEWGALSISQASLDADTWELVVTKQDGGDADVSVSAAYDGATYLGTKTVSFAKDDKNRSKKPALTLTNAKGLLAIVKVDAKGTNSFDYKFTFVKK